MIENSGREGSRLNFLNSEIYDYKIYKIEILNNSRSGNLKKYLEIFL